MIQAIVLDTTPLGLVVQRTGYPKAMRCRIWLAQHADAGGIIFVPDIIDYELRRELLRLRLSQSIHRLDQFYSSPGVRRLPITTSTLTRAAELWAQVRQQGMPTADRAALDIDVILAAQALSCGVPVNDLCVATSNVRHLARFVPAQEWTALAPPLA